MARITIDDCVDKVENQFELALLAARRAFQISEGSREKIAVNNDKPVVVALREIAAGITNDATIADEEKAVLEANRTIEEIRGDKSKRYSEDPLVSE